MDHTPIRTQTSQITFSRVCRACRAEPEFVLKLVEAGIIKPKGTRPVEWRFTPEEQHGRRRQLTCGGATISTPKRSPLSCNYLTRTGRFEVDDVDEIQRLQVREGVGREQILPDRHLLMRRQPPKGVLS